MNNTKNMAAVTKNKEDTAGIKETIAGIKPGIAQLNATLAMIHNNVVILIDRKKEWDFIYVMVCVGVVAVAVIFCGLFR